MKASNKKTIGTIKAKIGSVEIVTLVAFIILLTVSIRQFIREDFKIDWIYLIFSILTLMTLLLAFINYKNKTIILTVDSMIIKRPLGLYSRTYLKEQLKGYDLQEYYDNQIGLARQIRIWTKDDKQIILVRDAYSDYERVLTELKKFDLKYLGTVELTAKYKKLIGIGLQIITVLTMLMFATSALIRSLK
jgi:hypothetical protein